MSRIHESHKMRSSDSSLYDAVCESCGATDDTPETKASRKRLAEPCQSLQARMAEAEKSIAALGIELNALEHAARQATRLRFTAPVDDDFPQVKFEYDQSMRILIDAMREYGRFK